MLIGYGNEISAKGETIGMRQTLAWAVAVGLLFVGFACSTGLGQDTAADRWEPEIRKFEEQDKKSPPSAGANLFVGSSSIGLWKLPASFPNHVCINRGFGGSQLADSARYAERIVIPSKPSVVVLYAGDNDIASGKTPLAVRDDYRILRDKIQAALPETKIVVISLKPSPSRWKFREQAQEANRLLREEVAAGKNQTFVDVWKPMLGEDGMPRADLFVKDNLHMNETGYKVWNGLVEPHLALPPAG